MKNLPYAIAYANPETVDFSYEAVFLTKDIEGDIVECGVAMGAQIIAFKQALQVLGSDKKIWGFDSFQGIPLGNEFDIEQPGIGTPLHNQKADLQYRLVSSGVTSHSKEQVIGFFNQYNTSLERVELIEGWFQFSLPVYEKDIEKISILRLDGDLYESTLCSLHNLYPKVAEGGYVIVDDWGLEGCRKAITDYFERWEGEFNKKMIPVGRDTVHYFIK